VNDLFDLKTNMQAQEDSPGSATAQATAVKAQLVEEVDCRQEERDDFRRAAPEAVREKEPNTVRRDQPSATDSTFLAEWDGAA